jgi:hypothetical protein
MPGAADNSSDGPIAIAKRACDAATRDRLSTMSNESVFIAGNDLSPCLTSDPASFGAFRQCQSRLVRGDLRRFEHMEVGDKVRQFGTESDIRAVA